jgi:hypothetical protein
LIEMAMKRKQIGIKKIKNQNKNSSSGCPDESGFAHPSQLSSLPMRAKVINSERENDIVTLLTLDLNMPNAKPGQFVMAWVVGMDEKPISIAETKPSLQLAVAAVGPCSKKLAEAKIGETIFVRGPLGKPFSPIGKRWVLVGGGYGFAPLRFLARIGIESGCKVRISKQLMMEAQEQKEMCLQCLSPCCAHQKLIVFIRAGLRK